MVPERTATQGSAVAAAEHRMGGQECSCCRAPCAGARGGIQHLLQLGAHGLDDIVERKRVVAEPLVVRVLERVAALELLVLDDAVPVEVDKEDVAGFQAPFAHHLAGWHVHNTNLARHDHALVLRDVEAAWPQPVAVERSSDVPAICERHQRRAVPRLHHRGVEPAHRRGVNTLAPTPSIIAE
jgi:hypothetical protein